MRDPLAEAILTAWRATPLADRLMLATENPGLAAALQALAAASRISFDLD